jgi:hypothetical protein
MGVNHSSTTYYIRKNHTSDDNPTVDTDNYVEALTYDSTCPIWKTGINYTQYGAESFALSRYYLNQYANRHRVVTFESSN